MTSVQTFWYARTTSRYSSGSSCEESLVESTRSQNITVSCLRSASDVWDTTEGDATCIGCSVGVVGAGTSCAGGGTDCCPVSDVPHSLQNFAPGRFSVLQEGQAKGSGVPHASQNFAPSRFAVPRLVQSMLCCPYANSSNNALASFKSAVSKPSVNQLYTGASRSWASWRLPCCCQSRARLVAVRNSKDLACWFWAMVMACWKQFSASACLSEDCCNRSSPLR